MEQAHIHKVLITGPESTGKSRMSRQLAETYGSVWVPEYARTYLNDLSRPYEPDDLRLILRGQLRSEQEYLTKAERYLFCDTGPEVLSIWSQHKYGEVHAEIEAALQAAEYDFVLLMDIDLPWEPDPLRETPDPEVRQQLLQIYRELLVSLEWPFRLISGTGPQRVQAAQAALENFF
ncbi:MAG: ATP-binding protein [Leptolyngbya sp. SIO3F4]|nr:ATP-binding protein [Leptolyngbya sp. SIO3F4]